MDVVMVLGMHRSGTSALAGTLARLGCTVPARLMPANAGNPRGYFESQELMGLHDEILASAGSSWRDWRPFDPEWHRSATAASYRVRAKAAFAAEFGDAAVAVLKDPRICRFAPFWLGLLRDIGARTRVVIPLRPPSEVCLSLSREHGLPRCVGALLWLRHVLDAEAQSRAEIRSIVNFDHLLADWRGVAAKISAEAGISWPEPPDRTAAAIDEYLMRRQPRDEPDRDATGANPNPALHEWIALAYGALSDLSRNPGSAAACATLDRVRAGLDQSSLLFGAVLAGYENDLMLEKQRLAAGLDLISARLTTLLAAA